MTTKLNQECRVMIEDCSFKLPFSKSELAQTINLVTVAKITNRRQSVRLQNRQCMNEAPGSVTTNSDDVKGFPLTTVELPDTANAQFNELSDNYIVELLSEMTSFIKNGVWYDSTLDMSDFDWVCPSPDLTSVPMSPSSTVSLESSIDKSSEAFVPDNICVADVPRSMATQTHFGSQCDISTQTDVRSRCSIYTQTDCDHQCSVSTQVNQRSISTQTSFKEEKSVTSTSITQAKSENPTYVDSNMSQPIIKSSTTHSKRKSLKRKKSFSSARPSHQIIVKNYDLNNCTVNHRKVLNFKIPKLEHAKIENINPGPHPKPHSTKYQIESAKLLTPKCNFDLMKKQVLTLLHSPCVKFLKYENCGSYCPHNHFLPSANVVAETIKNWSNEMIHFFYITNIQRYSMCNVLYFEVICNVFVKRQLPDKILATVKDCEQLCLENHLKIVLTSLKKCGYSADDGLLEICVHAYRTKNTVNEILKIITTDNLVNFKRTIAFLATEIDTNDFDPCFGDEILKQACEIKMLDVTLLEFCYRIIKKYYNILNEDYMRMLLLKM